MVFRGELAGERSSLTEYNGGTSQNYLPMRADHENAIKP